MKVSAWLPILVLLAVALATGFSWYLSSSERQYLFDGEKGIFRPWVADWWTVKIPVAFALGVITSGTLIVLLRCARSRAWSQMFASLAMAALGITAVSGALFYVKQKDKAKPIECVRPTPQTPQAVFKDSQWWVLSGTPEPTTLPRIEHRLGPLRENGRGLKDRRGYIPFDPFLLERVTFVGLTAEEVENLIGSPIPVEYPGSAGMMYHMIGFQHTLEKATLYLSFGKRWERTDVVLAESVRQHLPRP